MRGEGKHISHTSWVYGLSRGEHGPQGKKEYFLVFVRRKEEVRDVTMGVKTLRGWAYDSLEISHLSLLFFESGDSLLLFFQETLKSACCGRLYTNI